MSHPEILIPGVMPEANCMTEATDVTETAHPSSPTKPTVSSPDIQEAKPSRPVRNRRLPERFKDYEC